MGVFPRINEPFKWSPIIRKAVRLYAEGMAQGKAAAEAGMTQQHLCLCMKHPEVQEYYQWVIMNTGLALKSEIVKSMKKIAEKKIEEALTAGDRDTALSYLKEVRQMLGLDEIQEEKKKITIEVL